MSAINWAQYSERAVGRGHPSLADVVNRPLRGVLSSSGYDPDASTFAGLAGPVFNVVSFGAVAGGTDCAPAHNAAIAAALAAGGGIVYYPPGFWYFTTQPVALGGTCSIIIQGSGRNATSLVMGTDGLVMLQLTTGATRVQINDLWVGSLSARATGYGLQAISGGTAISELVVNRVTFQNLPSPLHFDNVTQSTLSDVRYIQTIAGSTVGVMFYLVRCNGGPTIRDFQSLCTVGSMPSDGIRVDSDCDTVVLENCQIVLGGDGVGVAVRFMNSVGGASTGPRLCRATDCYAEDYSYGFRVDDARDVRLTNCHTANCVFSSYYISGGDSVTLTNSFAFHNQQAGFHVVGGKGVHLIGCTASNNSQQTSNTYDGIVLDTPTPVRVIGCRSGDLITTYANKQRRGLTVFTSGGHTIVYNDLQDNLTAPYADFSGSGTMYLRGNKYSTGARQGRAVLVGGTVTVNTVEVVASENIALTRVVTGGTVGHLTVGTIVAGTSFVINSSSGTDTSTVFWEIVH